MKGFSKIFFSAVLAASMLLTGCSGSVPGNISPELTLSEGDKIAEIAIEDYGVIRAKLFPDIAPNGVKNFTMLAEQGFYDGLKIHRVAADMCIQGGSLLGDGTGGQALVDKSGVFPIEVSTDARNFYGALGYANENGNNTTQFYIVNCKKQSDITQYDPATIRAEAAKITAQKEGMTETDPKFANLTAVETYYTNLANMIEKATEDVTSKYATTGGYPLWDGAYTVFGQVYDGFDVLDKISSVEVTGDKNGDKCKPVTDIIISYVKVMDYTAPQPESSES